MKHNSEYQDIGSLSERFSATDLRLLVEREHHKRRIAQIYESLVHVENALKEAREFARKASLELKDVE